MSAAPAARRGIRAATLTLFSAAALCGIEIRLADLEGHPLALDLAGVPHVVVFVSARCSLSNRYHARLETLYREFAPRGVRFLAANPNSTEPDDEVREHARKSRFSFPVLRDPGGVLAERLGVNVTPAALVLDSAGQVRYRGRIDDAENPARVRRQWLREALAAVLAGDPVETPETKVYGCTIKRPKP